ncbi:MAG: DNA polymerase IV [Bdellovibrionota bacterium]
MTSTRKIIHVDMDAFYASVEQRDFPEYRGKPVVVGGPANGRGVVAAASYEARKFGIRSAMPSRQAARLCPAAVFLKPRFEQYRKVSSQIMEIFHRVTDKVEPLSLDEAYLDVTENKLGVPLGRDLARFIKDTIRAETGLTASAGVAANKFLAKIASDFNKPDGLTVIPPERADAFLENLSVRKLPGVGPKTEERLAGMGVFTCQHLRRFSISELQSAFGKSGDWYYRIARGIDERPVDSDWERKSLGAEETFDQDLESLTDIERELGELAERVAERLTKRELSGRTITLKVTFRDFQKITRSRTREQPTCSAADLFECCAQLLGSTDVGSGRPVRLLGIQVSHFDDPENGEPEPLELPYQLEFEFRGVGDD